MIDLSVASPDLASEALAAKASEASTVLVHVEQARALLKERTLYRAQVAKAAELHERMPESERFRIDLAEAQGRVEAVDESLRWMSEQLS